MGIKKLNKFLLDNCSRNAIKKIQIKDLANKKLVVDTSIYLYKFVYEEALIENLFLMISIFKKYSIVPVFVFDGKPPPEKRELLMQRRKKRWEAQKEYDDLKSQISDDMDKEEIQELSDKMYLLKKQCTRISESDTKTAKSLLSAYGVEYYDADGEADKLCVELVMSGKVWACLSDDMDMLVYGCNRVIRNLSLMNHTCTLYNINTILSDLDMDMKVFREIMVISGTDYNVVEDGYHYLHNTIEWYYEYQKYLINKGNRENLTFYNWLYKYSDYIEDLETLKDIYSLFEIEQNIDNDLKKFKNHEFKFHENKEDELVNILKKEGFIPMLK